MQSPSGYRNPVSTPTRVAAALLGQGQGMHDAIRQEHPHTLTARACLGTSTKQIPERRLWSRPFYTLVATPSRAPVCRAHCSATGLHKNQCVAQIRKGFLVVKNALPQIRLPESTGACKCSRTAWAVGMLVTAPRRRVGVRGADV